MSERNERGPSAARRTAIAVVAGLSTLVAASGVATASDAGLAAVQARANVEIDRRVVALDRLTAVVTASHHLTDANRTALDNELSSARQGLTTLKATIAADTDVATARADTRRI